MTDKLRITDLQCRYQGKTVFDGLSMSVADNEILCLLGPSGCGKTTALKAIAGLMPTSGGEIHINDKTVNGKGIFVAPENRHLGMIFQDYALFPHMSVANNVGFALSHLSKPVIAEKVAEMLALVKLEHLAERYPHQLSGGQQQRVSIARALAYSPQLLLLDEPFSNIDTQVRLQLIEEIRDILKQRQMSAVFVTHSKEEGFAFADKMAVMNQGKIAQLDTPERLFNRPKTRFVAEFLGKGIYLPAEVAKDNTVSCQFGTVQSTAQMVMKAGELGELFVRPQYFQLHNSGGDNGQIKHKTFVGSGFNYQVLCGELLIDVFAPQNFELGQQVGVKVVPHDLHLFKR